MLIKKQILDYFKEEILPDDQIIDENTLLLQQGIIDSLIISKLISFLEKKYDITFEQQDINFKNFIHVNALSAFVENRQKVTMRENI